MIVGAIELRGRLERSARFGCVSESKLKSVSSLLSRNPYPGTTMPLPPVDSIVNVYDTTLPLRSATVRCVVDCRGWEIVALLAAAFEDEPSLSYGSPGATGLVAALSVISGRRSSANDIEVRPSTGTSKNAGSARKALRSANV